MLGSHMKMGEVVVFSITIDLGKYLGVPLIHKRVKRYTYQYLVYETNQKLSSWKSKVLSFAGRVVFTQTVLSALPTYTMQTALLPKGGCHSLEKICRCFVWGAQPDKRSCHIVTRDYVAQPESAGRLGWV